MAINQFDPVGVLIKEMVRLEIAQTKQKQLTGAQNA